MFKKNIEEAFKKNELEEQAQNFPDEKVEQVAQIEQIKNDNGVIALEEYKLMSYEEYKKQCYLKCHLRELAEIVYWKDQNVSIAVNKLLRLGIYLKRDKEKGYKMLPVTGAAHWSKEKWQEFVLEIKKAKLAKPMDEMFNRLAAVGDKPMYSMSCSTNPCFRLEQNRPLENACYLSSCDYAAKKFEELTSKSYAKTCQ